MIINILKFLEQIAAKILPYRIYLNLKQWVGVRIHHHKLIKKIKKIVKLLPYKLRIKHTKKNLPPKLETFSLILPNHKKEKTLLVIICAFTKRYEILAQSIKESFNSHYSSDIRWVLCGSTQDDFTFIKTIQHEMGHKISGILWNNNPLGEKWQAAVSFAKECYNSELYAITGSDDILSSGLLNSIIKLHLSNKKPPAAYCTRQWTIGCFNQTDGSFPGYIRCTQKQTDYFIPIGAGRFYTDSFLKTVNYKIFDETLERCLDDYSYLKIKELNLDVHFYSPAEGLLLSIKGNWAQMNSINAILQASSINSQEYSIKEYPYLQQNLSESTLNYLMPELSLSNTFTWCASSDTGM